VLTKDATSRPNCPDLGRQTFLRRQSDLGLTVLKDFGSVRGRRTFPRRLEVNDKERRIRSCKGIPVGWIEIHLEDSGVICYNRNQTGGRQIDLHNLYSHPQAILVSTVVEVAPLRGAHPGRPAIITGYKEEPSSTVTLGSQGWASGKLGPPTYGSWGQLWPHPWQ
jgi:hypothetical protein